jgi:hypothetical protein
MGRISSACVKLPSWNSKYMICAESSTSLDKVQLKRVFFWYIFCRHVLYECFSFSCSRIRSSQEIVHQMFVLYSFNCYYLILYRSPVFVGLRNVPNGRNVSSQRLGLTVSSWVSGISAVQGSHHSCWIYVYTVHVSQLWFCNVSHLCLSGKEKYLFYGGVINTDKRVQILSFMSFPEREIFIAAVRLM